MCRDNKMYIEDVGKKKITFILAVLIYNVIYIFPFFVIVMPPGVC